MKIKAINFAPVAGFSTHANLKVHTTFAKHTHFSARGSWIGSSSAWATWALPFVCLLSTGDITAFASEEAGREAEMFGSADEENPTPAPSATMPSATMPSATMPSVAIPAFVEQVNVGGRLEGRTDWQLRDNQKAGDAPLTSTFKADLSLEAKQSEELKGLFRVRFIEGISGAANESRSSSANGNQNNSGSVNGSDNQNGTRNVLIDEALLRFNSNQTVFYTIGKQHIKWGSARFWNPTDFLARESKDPFANFDARLGVWLAKIHIPIESSGSNFYALVDFSESSRLKDLRGALRVEQAVAGSSEVALSLVGAEKGPNKVGVDLSSALGAVDFYVEAAKVYRMPGVELTTGDFNLASLRLPDERSRKGKSYVLAAGGIAYSFNYTDSDSATVGAEYFENGLGYADKKTALYALATGNSSYLSTARRYIAGYFRLPNPFSWNSTTYSVSGIHNMVDKSTVLRAGMQYELGVRTFFELSYSHCYGSSGELCFAIPKSTLQALGQSPVASANKAVLADIPTSPLKNSGSLALITTF